MKANVLLLNTSLTNPNQGVNALTIGTLTALFSQFSHNVNVTLFGQADRSHHIRINEHETMILNEVGIRSRSMPKLITEATLGRSFAGTGRKFLAGFDKYLTQADYVIDLSEGDSFTDMYGLSRLLLQSLPRIAAITAGKRLLFFPQTYGPFTTKFGRLLAKWLLKQAHLVFTREPYSTAMLKNLVCEDKLIECSDMAFLMQPQAVDSLSGIGRNGFVGMNISGLLYHAEDNTKLQWNSDYYRSLSREIIVKYVEEFKQDVVLIPHVYAPGNREDDLAACISIYESLPSPVQKQVHIIQQPLSAPQLKHIISQATFFIGARMHSCIAAISSGVSAVPLSYSHKFQGVFKQLGLEELVCNPQRMSQSDILAKIDQIYCNREEITQRLSRAIPTAQQQALRAVSYL